MEKDFVCPICGNKDPNKIGFKNGRPYCRACLSFKGNNANPDYLVSKNSKLSLSYPLSEEQARCSKKILENFQNGIDTLVYAICGAGKTELIFHSILYALSNHLHVGFCVPRRDVVIEIKERLKEAFINNSVISVYGGHTETLNADIICLTSHQLFRYPSYFDLLIMDEIDAFPFKNNEVLNSLFFKSIKGHYIMMSATPSLKTLDFFKKDGRDIVTLFSRFHRHNLPVPEPFFKAGVFKLLTLFKFLKEFIKEGKQVFIFCPTIEDTNSLFLKTKCLFPNGNYVSSKRENREGIIEDFKKKKYAYLITTAILERGVTVDNLQVIIFDADSPIYDSYSLIQISGRVGRKKNHPDGRVIFICEKRTKDIEECIREIKHNNANLQNMF